jgi:hypothetical protein
MNSDDVKYLTILSTVCCRRESTGRRGRTGRPTRSALYKVTYLVSEIPEFIITQTLLPRSDWAMFIYWQKDIEGNRQHNIFELYCTFSKFMGRQNYNLWIDQIICTCVDRTDNTCMYWKDHADNMCG